MSWKSTIFITRKNDLTPLSFSVTGGEKNKYDTSAKFWVAKITGGDEKFGLKRDFLAKDKGRVYLKSGGVYEVYNSTKNDEERYFIYVENFGEKSVDWKKISKSEAEDILSGKSSDKKMSCSKAASNLRKEKSKAAAKELRCNCSPLPKCKGGLAGIGYIFGPHEKR